MSETNVSTAVSKLTRKDRIAMAVMPSKQPEMWASLACLGVIVVALFIKRAVSKPV